jgi:predicted RecB family endonuclease
LESTNLIELIDDAIQSTIESSDFYDSLENALSQVAVLEKQLERLSEQLKNLEEVAGLTTYQLHQVQEKLEYYLILTSKQSKMLDKSAKLQARTVILLANANR